MDELINPNIEQLWSWIKGYQPWIVTLKFAFFYFGVDTQRVDRQGVPVRIGDILSGNQHNFIWSGFDQSDSSNNIWQGQSAPVNPASLTPQEWAELKDPTKQTPPWPPPNPYADPHQDPWKIVDPHIVQLPDRTIYTYVVYPDPVRGIVGRTMFDCEQALCGCTNKEADSFYLTDFSNVVYIGNVNDTPEQFLLNYTAETDTTTPYAFKKLAEKQHFS